MINDRLRSHVAAFRTRNGVPALGAGILTRDGHLDLGVVGVRIEGGDDRATPDDRWHIGSCCKSLTAALYARLVERGDAEWGARIPDLFPDLADGMDRGWADVAIDDVLVHQAGLPSNLQRAAMAAAYRETRPLRTQRTEATAAALARPPRRPGRFRYSNLGYIVTGAAIERVTDLPFELALTAHVLEPLGIASGGFGPPPHLWGHGGPMLMLGPLVVNVGRRKPADPTRVESDNPAVMSPAGRLHLTLGDWAKFQRVFLTDGDGFLRPETIERLLTPASGPGQRQAMGWAAARGLADVSLGQQGSNTFWVATALIDRDRERSAMVACNDGRAKLLAQTARLAAQLLSRE